MEKAKEFLAAVADAEADRISNLSIPPHRPHVESAFYEHFILRGVKVDRLHQGSIFFSFRVPPRLTDSDGNLASGAIATLVDELGSASIIEGNQAMDVSVDMSIAYLSPAKMNDELEIESRRLGQIGGYLGTHVTIRNKTSGEVVAEGRHSLFRKRASKL